jgi:hypothetical protein
MARPGLPPCFFSRRGYKSLGLARNYPAVGHPPGPAKDTGGAMKFPTILNVCPLNHSAVCSLRPFAQKCNLFLLTQMARPAQP